MLPIIQVGDVLLSPDIFTECFCCDLNACGGICCVEGDAGAPVTLDEIADIEDVLPEIWDDMAPRARGVVNKQGVAYTDQEGDLVTSIVDGKDCAFTCYGRVEGMPDDAEPACLCAIEKAWREGRLSRYEHCPKPISCYLYPIRERALSNGLVALNYHKWAVCSEAVRLGRAQGLKVWQFLREPLVRRFGQDWYDELAATAKALEEAETTEP